MHSYRIAFKLGPVFDLLRSYPRFHRGYETGAERRSRQRCPAIGGKIASFSIGRDYRSDTSF